MHWLLKGSDLYTEWTATNYWISYTIIEHATQLLNKIHKKYNKEITHVANQLTWTLTLTSFTQKSFGNLNNVPVSVD